MPRRKLNRRNADAGVGAYVDFASQKSSKKGDSRFLRYKPGVNVLQEDREKGRKIQPTPGRKAKLVKKYFMNEIGRIEKAISTEQQIVNAVLAKATKLEKDKKLPQGVTAELAIQDPSFRKHVVDGYEAKLKAYRQIVAQSDAAAIDASVQDDYLRRFHLFLRGKPVAHDAQKMKLLGMNGKWDPLPYTDVQEYLRAFSRMRHDYYRDLALMKMRGPGDNLLDIELYFKYLVDGDDKDKIEENLWAWLEGGKLGKKYSRAVDKVKVAMDEVGKPGDRARVLPAAATPVAVEKIAIDEVAALPEQDVPSSPAQMEVDDSGEETEELEVDEGEWGEYQTMSKFLDQIDEQLTRQVGIEESQTDHAGKLWGAVYETASSPEREELRAKIMERWDSLVARDLLLIEQPYMEAGDQADVDNGDTIRSETPTVAEPPKPIPTPTPTTTTVVEGPSEKEKELKAKYKEKKQTNKELQKRIAEQTNNELRTKLDAGGALAAAENRHEETKQELKSTKKEKAVIEADKERLAQVAQTTAADRDRIKGVAQQTHQQNIELNNKISRLQREHEDKLVVLANEKNQAQHEYNENTAKLHQAYAEHHALLDQHYQQRLSEQAQDAERTRNMTIKEGQDFINNLNTHRLQEQEAQKAEADRNLSRAKEENAMFQQTLAHATEAHLQTERHLNETNHAKQQAEQRWAEEEAKFQQLLQYTGEQAREKQGLVQTVEGLVDTVRNAVQETHAVKGQLAQTEKVAQILSTKVQQFTDIINHNQGVINAKNQRIEQIHAKKRELKGQLEAVHDEREDREGEMTDMTMDVDNFQEELNALGEENEALERENAMLRERLRKAAPPVGGATNKFPKAQPYPVEGRQHQPPPGKGATNKFVHPAPDPHLERRQHISPPNSTSGPAPETPQFMTREVNAILNGPPIKKNKKKIYP